MYRYRTYATVQVLNGLLPAAPVPMFFMPVATIVPAYYCKVFRIRVEIEVVRRQYNVFFKIPVMYRIYCRTHPSKIRPSSREVCTSKDILYIELWRGPPFSLAWLEASVADPTPGSGTWCLDPGFRIPNPYFWELSDNFLDKKYYCIGNSLLLGQN